MTKPRTTVTAGLAAALIVIMVAPMAAQLQPVAARATGAVRAEAASVVEHVELLVGRSTILRTARPIKRVSLPRPEVADALVTSPREVLVHGKMPGTISLLIWGDNGDVSTYDVSVKRDLSGLEERVRQLFPGEAITVASNGADVVLSGIVSSKYVVEKAASLAGGYVERPENVVNLLRQQEGLASNQVLLRVRFAEVSRSALQELGASFFTSPTGVKNTLGRLTTQQFPAPGFDKLQWSKESAEWGAPVTSASGEFTFSDFLNLFLFSQKYDIGTMIRALSTKGLFQSLAEPNLVTQNGKEASFLAGGEYPYPVVQGGGANTAVTIMFKEFGVRLRFTPTIIGNDLVHLKVAPEVSALDFANSVTLEGFRVPALSTRRTETEVELRDGQTFAIAGLMDNSLTQTMSKVPGIGDIPILGLLFRSRAYQKNSTELVVMITPQILRRDSIGVTPNLPNLVEPYLPPEGKTIPPPPPAFRGGPSAAVAPSDAPGVPPQTVPAARTAAAPAEATTATPVVPVAVAPARPVRVQIDPALSVAPSSAAAPVPPAAPIAAAPTPDPKTAQKAAAEERKRAAEEEKRAAEEAKRQAAEQKRQEKEAQRAREIEAKRAREEAARQAKLDREKAILEARRAKEEAAAAAKREEEERRLAEIARRQEAEEAERLAREQKKYEEEQKRIEAEQQKLRAQQKKLEEQRAEAERRKLEERKKAQERAAKRRLLSDPYPQLRSRRPW